MLAWRVSGQCVLLYSFVLGILTRIASCPVHEASANCFNHDIENAGAGCCDAVQ